MTALFNKIKNLSPEVAYKINLGIYIFHIIVAIITFFYLKFPGPNSTS